MPADGVAIPRMNFVRLISVILGLSGGKADPAIDQERQRGFRQQNTDTWALVDETHNFEEWRQHYPNAHENTSRTIPFADLVRAVGQGDELAAIEEDACEACEIDRLFG